jgi:hypothetical protein
LGRLSFFPALLVWSILTVLVFLLYAIVMNKFNIKLL